MTEILYALGLEDRIVGVTTFCDHPSRAKEKPKIGGMSNPSLEAVVSLKPDIVVMTTDGNPKEFQMRLNSLNIKTYVFRARRIYELPDAVREMGRVLGIQDSAEELARRIEQTIERFRGARRLSGKKVLFIIWPEPLIVAGPNTAINDVIELLGYKNIASGAGMSYPKYSIEEVIRQKPDFIIIGRGSGHESIEKVSKRLLDRLRSTPAVRNNRVFYMSDSLYRLGPRVIDGMEEMAKILTEGGK
jgi:iron complex transport system substrate-binding protein